MHMKSKGSFILGISRASIEKIIISLPPLSEQKAKSKEIEKLQRKIDELESQITRAKKQMEEI